MIQLQNGKLSIDNTSLNSIQSKVDTGLSIIDAFKTEIEPLDIDIQNIYSVELSKSNFANENYIKIYSKLICEIWNS